MNSLLVINWIATIAVIAYAVYLFAYLVKSRIEFIKLGKKPEFLLTTKERINNILVYVFGQKKLLKDTKSGIIHVMFFYGFILVQFGAIDVIWKGLKPGSHLPFGPLYPAFTFFQEIVTFLVLIAVAWGFYRRYIEKIPRLKRTVFAGLVYYLIATLMLTVLLSNGMEILWHEQELAWTSPIASLIAFAFQGISPTAAAVLFY